MWQDSLAMETRASQDKQVSLRGISMRSCFKTPPSLLQRSCREQLLQRYWFVPSEPSCQSPTGLLHAAVLWKGSEPLWSDSATNTVLSSLHHSCSPWAHAAACSHQQKLGRCWQFVFTLLPHLSLFLFEFALKSGKWLCLHGIQSIYYSSKAVWKVPLSDQQTRKLHPEKLFSLMTEQHK